MKRLYRSQKNRVLAGICGGLGEYYNVDPVLVRIIAIFLTLFLCFPFLVYLVAICAAGAGASDASANSDVGRSR
jgi:phage shock protein C